jgi:hypothetical protein
MEITEYFRRRGTARAIATLLALGLMLDVVWDGKSGSGCKSAIETSHVGR